MEIVAPAVWPQNCMFAHKHCCQRPTVAAEVVAGKPDTVRDYMADELSASVECRQVVVDTGLAATEIGFEQNAGGCKASAAEGETERQRGKVGTDVDILTTPGPQKYFGLATEGCMGGLLDCL